MKKQIIIRKFDFPELSVKVEELIEAPQEEVVVTQEKYELEEFADHNALNETGHTVIEEENITPPNLITMTQDELNDLIAQNKEIAVKEYIAMPKPSEDEKLQQINDLILEIKNRLNTEMNDVLEQILNLSYAIAEKVIGKNLITMSNDHFVDLIHSKLNELHAVSNVSIQVSNEEVAELLRKNGIEVSVNGDMLPMDYKIIWCNGFLERNTGDVASQIEKILMNQMKD